MAFNNYSNNKNNNTIEYSVYSNYRMNNAESKIDATCLTFKYWRTSLCIGIFPKKNTGNDEIAFDMDNGITIFLTHTKARILRDELANFIKDPKQYNGCGVPSGSAIITISNGSELGSPDSPCLMIRKLGENGNVTASFAYQFKTNYYYSVRNYTGTENHDTDYEDYKYLEIEQVIMVLDEYIKAVTNAVAFTVMDQRKYSLNRVEGKIEAIADKLGVEVTKNSVTYQKNGGSKYNSTSHFANSNSDSSSPSNFETKTTYETVDIDDIY